MDANMKAPFPYFGGKSVIAKIVWQALGQPKHYIEPFGGSLAVLLNRPNFNQQTHAETVCDLDPHIDNVWRALQFAPDEVAKWCDWPVHHTMLIARKAALIKSENKLVEDLKNDPKFYDAELAGYWIWKQSCWIGSGLTSPGQIPHIGNAGCGVHAVGQRPHLSDAEVGVQSPYNTGIYHWFRVLSERLRYVRVVCGDWTRVCGGNWQDNMGNVGFLFDPPYAVEDRDTNIYAKDSTTVAKDVEDWCLERGKQRTYRIVCAGYIGEYDKLMSAGWTTVNWKTQGGYAHTGDGQGKENRNREILVLSPHCLGLKQTSLFQE